ncbi:NineTeen Complex (NTC) component [Rhodotorula sphaerocarpa]
MLHRFRDAQAAELGLVQKTDRRPRVAATCKDLRQCERWRGEILREISRKVSKIQDAGLTDYEVRDLNDQINKLLREKFHWENQIVALGGANYKRAAGRTTDADGREVPGQRGYKYFGRARELPGVRELFATAAADQAELESYKTVKVTMFDNAPPEYFGNLAEEGEEGRRLLEAERRAEEAAWDEAVSNLEDEIEGAPTSLPLPSRHRISLHPTPQNGTSTDAAAPAGKRKAPTGRAGGKKKKLADGTAAADGAANDGDEDAEADGDADMQSADEGGFESVFAPEQLQAPKLLSAQEMEKAIVQRQKALLLEEYGVEQEEQQ